MSEQENLIQTKQNETNEENIIWNKERWNAKNMEKKDKFGYCWGGGYKQSYCLISKISDIYLKPFIQNLGNNRYDLKILELAPGGGRFTAELLRYARELHIVDLNHCCISLCRERFKYYDNINYYTNDGKSIDIKDNNFDLIASFDSMVHMNVDIIDNYLSQFSKLISNNGIIWIDHSGKGFKKSGHRTEMDYILIEKIGKKYNLALVKQHFRNDHDCISIFKKIN